MLETFVKTILDQVVLYTKYFYLSGNESCIEQSVYIF